MMTTLAYAQEGAGQAAQAGPINLLPILAIFAIFYFVVFRPQKKSQDNHAKMIKNLVKNDQIVTSGGIYGTIVNVKETTFFIRIDEGVRVEIDKTAVARLIKKSGKPSKEAK